MAQRQHLRRLERRLLSNCLRGFYRFQPHHQAVARDVPGVAVGNEQVEHNPGDREGLFWNCSARRVRMIFLQHRSAFLRQSNARIGQVDDQPGRRIQHLNRGRYGMTGNNFDRWNTCVLYYAHTGNDRRLPLGNGPRLAGILRRASTWPTAPPAAQDSQQIEPQIAAKKSPEGKTNRSL